MKKTFLILLGGLLAFFLGILFGTRFNRSSATAAPMCKTDTAIINETIRVEKPKADRSRLLGYVPVNVALPVSPTSTKVRKKVITLPRSTTAENDAREETVAENEQQEQDEGTSNDNDEPPAQVMIPIEQRHYAGEGYEAWVSGYEASLDSVHVRREEKVITREREVTKWKPRRWGLSVGAGGAVTGKGVEPCVFVGVTYNLWNF